MSLDKLFYPESIVVIGASGKAGSLGRTLTENVLSGFAGRVYLVNVKGGELFGRKVYRSVSELPETPDIALIIIPAKYVPSTVEECGKMGVKAVVVLSGGFREVGPEGALLERELVEEARKYGVRVVGPNCVGIMNFKIGLDATFTSREHQGRPGPGPISLVTQSGAIGSMMLDLSAEMGLGYSKYVSVGNMCDVSLTEIVEYLAEDPDTGIIAAYIEGVNDGRRLMAAVRRAREKGKVFIAFKTGMTSAGVRAAASHTGSLAGSYQVFKAAIRQAGGIIAETLEDFLGYLQVFSKARPPRGGRVVVLTNAGGMGVTVSDMLEKCGLEVPRLSGKAEEVLRSKLPPYNTIVNPVDISGDAGADRYDEVLRILRGIDGIDIIVVVSLLQTPAINGQEFVETIAKHFRMEREKTIVALVSGAEYSRRWVKKLAFMGVPTYASPAILASSLSAYVEYHLKQSKAWF